MNKRLMDFLSADHEPADPDYPRIPINHLAALFCLGGALVFIPITAYLGNYPVFGVLIIMACIAIFNLWALRSGNRLTTVINLTAASLVALFLVLVITSPNWPSGLYWTAVLPAYFVFALEPHVRWRWIGGVLGLLALLMLGHGIGPFGAPDALPGLMSLTAVFCVITALCLAHDHLRTVTERQLSLALAQREAEPIYDELTGLPNRYLLNSQMEAVIANALRHQRPCTLLLIDLDGFRNINESMGRDAGDEVLTVSAGRLRKALRTSDFIGRYGGDEFIALLPEVATEQQINAVTRKCIRMLGKPIPSQEGLMQIGVNIGIARLAEDGDNLDTLIAAAYQAVETARREGSDYFAYARAGYALS